MHATRTSLFGLAAGLWACGGSADDTTVASTSTSTTVGAGGMPSTSSAGGSGGSAGEGGGSGCDVDVEPAADVVVTEHGAFRGVADGRTLAFKGIPFAAPPVGSLRWRPPEDPGCFEGIRDAAVFGASCLQNALGGGLEGSEDCLTLNVWAPADRDGPPRAVMVFVHGGANVSGSGSSGGDADPLYHGRPLVEGAEVVFVSINYRLGALGFLSHPALTAEDDHGSSGNYGLLDQIAALGWVQRNIAAFGGDPTRVMVFGESAGALNSCALYTSPLAHGLFSRVLMQSGGCIAHELSTAETLGTTMASGLGCEEAPDPLQCMRALPAEDLVAAQPAGVEGNFGPESVPFLPVVDGHVLHDVPLAAIAAGKQADVPFTIGTNADEMTVFVPLVVTENDYVQTVYDTFGPSAGDVLLQTYSVQSYGSPRDALVALSTDYNFTCHARQVARAARSSQSSPVYRYYFTHALVDAPLLAWLGAFHALELFFVFQKPGVPSYGFNPEELDLSQQMLGYWTRFAVDGDPGGPSPLSWPSYDSGDDPHLVLDTPIAQGDGVRSAECDLLESLLP